MVLKSKEGSFDIESKIFFYSLKLRVEVVRGTKRLSCPIFPDEIIPLLAPGLESPSLGHDKEIPLPCPRAEKGLLQQC